MLNKRCCENEKSIQKKRPVIIFLFFTHLILYIYIIQRTVVINFFFLLHYDDDELLKFLHIFLLFDKHSIKTMFFKTKFKSSSIFI